MTQLLSFTEAAVEYIQGMLIKNNGIGFRVSVKTTGCSGYSYAPSIVGEPVEGDLHFQAQKSLNIYIDPQCVDYVKGLTVDYVEEKKEGSLKQKRLIFVDNPNEKSRCGCGESFHV
jgi:iron-sulfur cluster assembly accessory protein